MFKPYFVVYLFSYFKTLSIYKITNIFLLNISYLYNIISKKKYFHAGNPMHISIEPTTYCNLQCLECPSGQRKFTRNTGYLSINLFQTIIHQLKKNLIACTLYFQGEPLLHKDIFKFIKILKVNHIHSIISTNGMLISQSIAEKLILSGLNTLIVSVDGTTNETYKKYRVGGDLNTVLKGISFLIEARKRLKKHKPYIIVQFLVTADNEHQIKEIKQLVKNLGVDKLHLKTVQLYDYKHGHKLMPKNNKYSRYKQQTDGTYKVKSKMQNKCKRMWTSCVFTWDGWVVPCCFDKDADNKMGNISKENFSKIWLGSKYTQFRKQLKKHRTSISICRNCTEGTKVWL